MRTTRRRTPSNMIGKTPTNSQKLVYVANKLGLSGIAGMQGSTVNIVDTVIINSGATKRQTINFFENTQNKSRNFSNFQNGSLSSGEALVMEDMKLFVVQLSSDDLTSDATRIINIFPLSNVDPSQMSDVKALGLSLMSISIANSTVVKDYQINESNPWLNPKNTGIAQGFVERAGSLAHMSGFVGNSDICLESPPVLPPNQKLKVTLEIPPLTGGNPFLAIMCVVGKFGSIYSAKTTL